MRRATQPRGGACALGFAFGTLKAVHYSHADEYSSFDSLFMRLTCDAFLHPYLLSLIGFDTIK